MKELRWIALILTISVILLVVLMAMQTYGLYRQNKALFAALNQTQTDIAALRDGLSEFSEAGQALRELWQKIEEKGEFLKWLN